MNSIQKIHACLADDVANMDRLIVDHLSAKEELVELVGKYLIDAGGKRIRPLLTILSSKMFGYSNDDHIKLAAAVEFIHVATLLHDDVVDESTMRRFKPTAHTIWGSKISVLVGDFLFSQAFKLMVATNSVVAMRSLSRASAIIADGEVSQLVKLHAKSMITVDEYNVIIQDKTAELFAAACEVGAIIANQPPDICKTVWNFGLNLGNIFQIIDDLLDYFGAKSDLGKNIGDDFLEGKVTLPLILLYDSMTTEDKNYVTQMLQNDNRSMDDFTCVKKFLDTYNIKDQIISYVMRLKSEVDLSLQQINIDNQYKQYLMDLVEFTVNRSF